MAKKSYTTWDANETARRLKEARKLPRKLYTPEDAADFIDRVKAQRRKALKPSPRLKKGQYRTDI